MPDVTPNNTGQSTGGLSATSMTISSFVVGAGANRCLFVGIATWNGSDVVPTSVVFNGSENFTLHDTIVISTGAPGFVRVLIYKLLNPSQVTGNIVVTWPSAIGEIVVGATCWNNVSGLGTAVKNTTSPNATSSSVAVPNAAGDVVHDAISAYGFTTATLTASHTQRWRQIAAADTTEGAGQSAVGTGSNITLQWSNIANNNPGSYSAHIGVAIQRVSDVMPEYRTRKRMAIQQRAA
jgi:hypothetical protein